MRRVFLLALIFLMLLCHAPSPSNGIVIERGHRSVHSPKPTQAACLRLRGGGRILRGLKYLFVQSTSPLPREVVRYLYAQKIAEHELPVDIFQALRDGRANLDELRAYVRMMKGGGLARKICSFSPLLRDRAVLHAKFIFILLCEIAIGCVSKLSAQVMMLGWDVWRRADLVLLSLLLEIVGDVLVVCLFFPAATMHEQAPAWLMRMNPLMWRIEGVPASAFLPGSYSWKQRWMSVMLRGTQLFVLSFCITMLGELCSALLLSFRTIFRRRRVQEDEESSEEMQEEEDAVEQGGRWDGAAMVRRAALFALRFFNCWLGGILWLTQQRLIEQRRLQKVSEQCEEGMEEGGERGGREGEEEEEDDEYY